MADADAAVAMIHARGSADSVLLMRRAERKGDPWSGQWSFPGGRCHRDDRDLLHTALRELQEECGIHLDRDRLEAALPLTVARRRVGRFLKVAPFIFNVGDELPASVDAREAVEAVWVRLAMLRDPARHELLAVPGLPPETRFPAIDLNGVPLWGFTYRLIADWLGLNSLEGPIEEAGFATARRLLDALIAHGCALDYGWMDRDGVKVAAVKGCIPVDLVLAEASGSGAQIPGINMLEVRPECVRVVGLGFEEYVIVGQASWPIYGERN
jgi:8-oxo-dGTP pyrophosphatase MutT (NUDIX family)